MSILRVYSLSRSKKSATRSSSQYFDDDVCYVSGKGTHTAGYDFNTVS